MNKFCTRGMFALSLIAGLGACSTIASLTGASAPWTPVASADVEVNAALGAITYLKAFEATQPGLAAPVKALGLALAAGVNAQASSLVAGAGAGPQSAAAAISATIAAAPTLSELLTSKISATGSAITVATDLASLLATDAAYVLPSIAAANTGTITATQLASDESALSSAASAL